MGVATVSEGVYPNLDKGALIEFVTLEFIMLIGICCHDKPYSELQDDLSNLIWQKLVVFDNGLVIGRSPNRHNVVLMDNILISRGLEGKRKKASKPTAAVMAPMVW